MTAPIRPDPFAALDAPADPFAALDTSAPSHHSIGQSLANAGNMLGHLATHPWEIPVSVVTDAMQAITPNTMRPDAIPAPRVPVGPAPFAARSDETYVPDPSRTRHDPTAQSRALLNTAVNVALPFIPAAGIPAKLALGAGVGAFYARDDDPLAGALAGLTVGGLLHGAGRLAERVQGAPEAGLAPIAARETPAPADQFPAQEVAPPNPTTAPEGSGALDGPRAPAADPFTTLDAPPPTSPAEGSGPPAATPEASTYRGPPPPAQVTTAAGRPTVGKAVVDAIQKTFLPASRSPEAAETANIIRAANARRARDVVVGEAQRAQFGARIGKLPIARQLAIDNAIEGGVTIPEHADAINTIRRDLDAERDAIRALGTGMLDQYRVNYLPHLWTDPAKAAELIAPPGQDVPLVGHPGFLKPRRIETLQQGIDLGLEPVSYNPVDLANLRLREMRRYRMEEEIRQEMAEKGLDPMTSKPVARVLNNFLAPGLRGNPIYDSYMSVGNMLNQAQLGLSAFHAGMTTIEQIVSQNALGVGALLRGDVPQAAKLMLTSPIAPLSQLWKGSKLLREYARPGSVGGPMTAMAEALVQGGGRIEADFHPTHLHAFRQAVQQRDALGTTKTFLPAMLEASAKPIMEKLVPRQKLGVFYDLAQREMEQLPPGAPIEDVRAAMGRAWDSVDNRLGSVVYENLFWNKTAKDLLHASVRSIGWNWGTWRELGGGAADWTREAANLVQGKATKLTPRMEYVVALPMTVGLLGALTTYLYTGKGPQSLKDYFYPPTGRLDADGNPERVRLPTYMRDAASYFAHPVRTVQNKANPLLSAIGDMLENEDFYGNEVRNPDDPFLTQLRQVADFAGQQFVPFTIRNAEQQIARSGGSALPDLLLNAIGVTPATAEERRTPAQNLMAEMLSTRAPSRRTPEDVATQGARRDARQRAQHGDWSGIASAVEQGVLRPQGLRTEARQIAKGTPALVQRFNQLTLPEAERVYQLGTPAERQLWLLPLTEKRVRAVLPR